MVDYSTVGHSLMNVLGPLKLIETEVVDVIQRLPGILAEERDRHSTYKGVMPRERCVQALRLQAKNCRIVADEFEDLANKLEDDDGG